MSRFRYLWIVVLAAAAGCSGDLSGPAGAGRLAGPRAWSGSGSPEFVTASSTAPAIANPTISFTAVKGQSYKVQMLYTTGDVFLTFKLDRRSLEALPDGTPVADGQGVPITITLVDPVHLIVEFQPSGLRFAADHPAELTLSYLETDPDRNGDGVVNAADSTITAQLRIWKQETSTDPWQFVPSTPDFEVDEVSAVLQGFTSYGIAY